MNVTNLRISERDSEYFCVKSASTGCKNKKIPGDNGGGLLIVTVIASDDNVFSTLLASNPTIIYFFPAF